jgi:hypothetical protein
MPEAENAALSGAKRVKVRELSCNWGMIPARTTAARIRLRPVSLANKPPMEVPVETGKVLGTGSGTSLLQDAVTRLPREAMIVRRRLVADLVFIPIVFPGT